MFEYAKPETKQKEKSKSAVQKKQQELTRSNQTGTTDGTKTRFENLSGISFDDVRIHYNSDKPAQSQASAYTQENQVYVASGQEKHLGHELGHVVQQKQERTKSTINVEGLPVNDDDLLEREEDNYETIQRKQAIAPHQDAIKTQSDKPIQLQVLANAQGNIVVQLLGGVARELYRNMGIIPCQVVGRNDLYIPSNGGHPHIHAWVDGCGIHHMAGMGNLINANIKNQGNVTAAIGQLQEMLAEDGDAELIPHGGRQHIYNLLRGVQLVNEQY